MTLRFSRACWHITVQQWQYYHHKKVEIISPIWGKKFWPHSKSICCAHLSYYFCVTYSYVRLPVLIIAFLRYCCLYSFSVFESQHSTHIKRKQLKHITYKYNKNLYNIKPIYYQKIKRKSQIEGGDIKYNHCEFQTNLATEAVKFHRITFHYKIKTIKKSNQIYFNYRIKICWKINMFKIF